MGDIGPVQQRFDVLPVPALSLADVLATAPHDPAEAAESRVTADRASTDSPRRN